MSTTHFSGPVDVGSSKYEAITTTAKTITYADSGKTFLLGGTGVAITMPALNDSFNCKFVVSAVFGTDYVITFPTGKLAGPIIAAGVVVTCTGAATLTLEDGAEALGDAITVEYTGAICAVTGQFQTTSSCTVG
jgi:hypothetical protein